MLFIVCAFYEKAKCLSVKKTAIFKFFYHVRIILE